MIKNLPSEFSFCIEIFLLSFVFFSISKSQNSRLNSSCSIDESYRTPCSHQNSLISLRTNVWILLRMLLPQLSLYYPSTLVIDYESDQAIDRLVTNLIQ